MRKKCRPAEKTELRLPILPNFYLKLFIGSVYNERESKFLHPHTKYYKRIILIFIYYFTITIIITTNIITCEWL